MVLDVDCQRPHWSLSVLALFNHFIITNIRIEFLGGLKYLCRNIMFINLQPSLTCSSGKFELLSHFIPPHILQQWKQVLRWRALRSSECFVDSHSFCLFLIIGVPLEHTGLPGRSTLFRIIYSCLHYACAEMELFPPLVCDQNLLNYWLVFTRMVLDRTWLISWLLEGDYYNSSFLERVGEHMCSNNIFFLSMMFGRLLLARLGIDLLWNNIQMLISSG